MRVTVSCAAGLACEMPIWGLSLRGDQAWAVRAVRPTNVVVLREGERSLVQASLVDADGKGVPSAERLMKAVLLATPAVPFEIVKAVDVQRDGALDPTQHGQSRPITLQKRELNRFLDGIKEYESLLRQRQERKEMEALEAEMEAGQARRRGDHRSGHETVGV